MSKNTKTERNLVYYKGRLLDLESLAANEKDVEWLRAYLIVYAKCIIKIKEIEARLGIGRCRRKVK